MPMMTSQILKYVGTKTQKSKYLDNKTLFFLQMKKFIYYISRATLCEGNLQVNFIAYGSKQTFLLGFDATFLETSADCL